MNKFLDLWKANAEKAVEDYMPSYIKRLNISAGIPSKVVDASYAEKTPDSNSVGASFAGPIPNSLLARQDLEGTTKASGYEQRGQYSIRQNEKEWVAYDGRTGVTVRRPRSGDYSARDMRDLLDEAVDYSMKTTKTIRIAKDGSDHDLTVVINNGSEETAKAVFEGCELSEIVAEEDFMGQKIYVTPPMTDSNGKSIGCYVVLGHDSSLQAFFSVEDARGFIESVLSKGAIEDTQKDLVEMAQEAKEGESSISELVSRIKSIQKKRQKATIGARAGESKKSFSEAYGALTSN